VLLPVDDMSPEPSSFDFLFPKVKWLQLTDEVSKSMSCLCRYKCSAVAETGDRLATIDMGRKLGAVPLLRELDPVQHNVAWAEAYLRTK